MQDDLVSVYGFLQHTNQGNLKRILVDGKFTDVHFNLLMKIVKNCTEPQFIELIGKGEFPRVKMSSGETAIRENFWKQALEQFQSRGLVNAEPAAKAA
jgi:hypothetical protein